MWKFAVLTLAISAVDAVQRYNCTFDPLPASSGQMSSKKDHFTTVRTCSTPYANAPVIQCPAGYSLTNCTLQTGTKPCTKSHQLCRSPGRQRRSAPTRDERPEVRLNFPEERDCSITGPCPNCRLTAHCQPLPPPSPPTPDRCAGVAGQTTCGGLTYEYVKHAGKDCEFTAATVIKKIGRGTCQAYCDALCDCRSFTWASDVFPADPYECHIYTIECRTNYLIPIEDSIYSYDGDRDGDYYVKRVAGQLSNSWVLSSTGGVPNSGWTTCDGLTYSYYEVVGQTIDSYHGFVYQENLSLAQCETACSQDCQCTAILHKASGAGTCKLVVVKVNQHMLAPIGANGFKLFIRQTPGAPTPVFTGTCGNAAYSYLQFANRDNSWYQNAFVSYTLPTVNDCKAKCSDYCHCKAFSAASVPSGISCKLFPIVAEEEILTLSTNNDYYVKQGPGYCPPNLATNCNDLSYTFTAHSTLTCANSYNLISLGPGFMKSRSQCEKICVNRCDCEGYVFNVFQYEQTDYSCYIKGPGCVANLVTNANAYYDDEYTSMSEVFYERN